MVGVRERWGEGGKLFLKNFSLATVTYMSLYISVTYAAVISVSAVFVFAGFYFRSYSVIFQTKEAEAINVFCWLDCIDFLGLPIDRCMDRW